MAVLVRPSRETAATQSRLSAPSQGWAMAETLPAACDGVRARSDVGYGWQTEAAGIAPTPTEFGEVQRHAKRAGTRSCQGVAPI